MNGIIDRLGRTSAGVWQIHDYKTDKRLPTQADKDADPQLAYYEIGIRWMWPDIERVELIWHYLRFDQAICSTRTADQLAALRHETIAVITDIESRGRDADCFPTKESRLCDYCEYQVVCPVRKHLTSVQKLPKNKFLDEPGVQLVDKWIDLKSKLAELQARIDTLESEIEDIKEALAVWAEAHGMTTVMGSDNEVAIVAEKKVLFPRKGQEPEAAQEFELKLRKTPWWDQVSTLDRTALATLWKNRERQAAELRILLDEYAWIEEETRLRLRKRRH
jgi:putative RecB family exonuclease